MNDTGGFHEVLLIVSFTAAVNGPFTAAIIDLKKVMYRSEEANVSI